MSFIEHLRFSEILALITCLTGAIWGIDTLFFKHGRQLKWMGKHDISTKGKEPWVVEQSKSFFPVFLLVLLIRSFLFEPFRIPTASMVPSLLIGDFILVNKYDYGLKLPLLNHKLVSVGAPKRGDVIVFRHSADKDLIKRVVGVPGDRISYRDKILSINGAVVPTEFVAQTHTDFIPGGVTVKQYNEYLDKVKHTIFICPDIKSQNAERYYKFSDIVVPSDSYFVLGDNRDLSEDSRYWGFVQDKDIIGRAFAIWMSWHADENDIRWERLAKKIQ